MKRKLLSIILISIMAFSLAACGGSADTTSADITSEYTKGELGLATEAMADTNYIDSADEYNYEEGSTSGSETEVDLDGYDMSRKIVYTSYISLESKAFDNDVASVQKLVSENGGYFENTSSYGNSEYENRSANFTARIPSDKYDAFMNSVGEVGSVTSKSESVDDITANYVDVQARLKSLNTKLERLQELEAKAETVTDLLEIEDRINEVQYQIETYTAQKRVYDDQVDYSTVNIDIYEVATYTEVKADTAWNRFTKAFKGSFEGFLTFLQNLVIGIIYVLPYLIIIIIILVIVLLIRKKKGKTISLKKNKNKPAENQN